MLKFIVIFSLCSIINVMLNTVKTIVMYKQNKLSSSLINAVTYGFYTVIVVLMAGEMALWLKIVITAITNFLGVWLSMLILEKLRKDKLWKVETTIHLQDKNRVANELIAYDIPYSIIELANSDSNVFYIYCKTQKDSLNVKKMLTKYNVKYFVSESLTL